MGRTRRQRRKLVSLAVVAVVAAGSAWSPTRRGCSNAANCRHRHSLLGPRAGQAATEHRVRHDRPVDVRGTRTSRGCTAAFPSRAHTRAKVIEAIDRGGAKTIAVDIEFTVRTDAADDAALAEAVAVGARQGRALHEDVAPRRRNGDPRRQRGAARTRRPSRRGQARHWTATGGAPRRAALPPPRQLRRSSPPK